MRKIFLGAFICLLCSCSAKKASVTANQTVEFPKFDTEGHRGGRGLMPENTIPAMIHAIDLGITTLEMDTHITADGKVVVAHDDYINPAFAYAEGGVEIPKTDAKKYPIFKLKYDELKKFDVGSKYYDAFPDQKKLKVSVPLLSDLIDTVQTYLKNSGKKQMFYNIETKCDEKGDGTLNPEPAVFVDLLMNVIEKKGITPYVVIQSFDKRTIQIINKKYPYVKTSFLTSNEKKTFEDNITELGYSPFIYSPNSKLVDAALVKKCHDKGIRIVPWTVNTSAEIAKLKALGVDGIISDYPNLLVQ